MLLRTPDPRPYLCVRNAAHDVHVVGSILRDGIWEAEIVSEFRDAVVEHDDVVVLDVGAHVGQYTIVAAAAGARVVSFEANSDNVRFLESSVDANGFADRVFVINKPVSSTVGERLSYSTPDLPADNIGGWGVQPSPDGPLKSTTIDASLRLLNVLGPYVMKIDIEGYEPHALRGARTTLERTRVIFMEWGDGGPEKRRMARDLVKLGFAVNDAKCRKSGYKRCPWDVVWRRTTMSPRRSRSWFF